MSHQNATVFWCCDSSGVQLALIVRGNHAVQGVDFLTPPSFGQQLAVMNRPKGEHIPPHYHLPVNRDLVGTQEVLVIRSGKLRVDLYDSSQVYQSSVILGPGDVALLSQGGHGFEVLEDTYFHEIKQGPFVAEVDKVRFEESHKRRFRYID